MTDGAASQAGPAQSAAPVSVGTHDSLFLSGALEPPRQPGGLASLDRFTILRQIGAGGMGIVFEAIDPQTKSRYAIKMLRPELVDFPDAVKRFLTEAGHMHHLAHPHILRVTEVVDRPRGPYYVMPFMDAGPLSARLRPGHPLDEPVATRIARQVADALVYAHHQGIIHRDIKPPNILLGTEGDSYLSDFGLVRTVYNDAATGPAREGTAAYMSPAVAAGAAEDTRCDIYSFGATLYEMITGSPPYDGANTEEVVRKVLAGPPRPIRRVNRNAPPGLVRVAEGCMARELRDRYAQMSDVLADLDRGLRQEPPRGPRGGKPGSPALRISLATVAMIAGFVIADVLWQSWRTHPPAPVVPATRPGVVATQPIPQTVPSQVIKPSISALQARLAALDPTATDVHLEDLPITDTDLVYLERLTRAEHVWLRGTHVTDAGLVHLKGMKQLQSLGLSHTRVTGTGFGDLKDLRELQKVIVGDCPLTDEGLAYIVALRNLQELNLRNCPITPKGLEKLKTATRLRVLDLWGITMTDAGLRQLGPLVFMESLDVRGAHITDAGLKSLGSMQKLSRLNLKGTGVTGAGLVALPAPAALSVLDLSQTPAGDAGMDAVARFTSLRELDLHSTHVSDVGLGKLRSLKRLSALDVTNTLVSDESVDAIREAIPGIIIRH